MNINLDNVDWKLLREQKLWLMSAIKELDLQYGTGDDGEGLLALIDDIQDQAALILGEDAVFDLVKD